MTDRLFPYLFKKYKAYQTILETLEQIQTVERSIHGVLLNEKFFLKVPKEIEDQYFFEFLPINAAVLKVETVQRMIQCGELYVSKNLQLPR